MYRKKMLCLIMCAIYSTSMGCGSSTPRVETLTPDLEEKMRQQEKAVIDAEKAYQQSQAGKPPAGTENQR